MSGSSTRRPLRCGLRFWTREPTSARFARCIGFWRSTARSESAGTNGAIRTTPSRSCWPKRPTRFGRGISPKLRGPVKWTYYYLYVILDIFSRYVVGWMLAHRESAALAQRLIAESCRKQDIEPDQLTLHADRGSSMRSKPVGLLLADLWSYQDPLQALRLERQSLLRVSVQDDEVLSSVSEPLWFRRRTAGYSAAVSSTTTISTTGTRESAL